MQMSLNGLTPLFRAAQVREFDRLAIQRDGMAGYEDLMVPAGAAAFGWLQKHWPHLKRLLVVCGGGNNAGDGYVLARLAREAGYVVTVGYLKAPESLQGDANQAWQDATDSGVQCVPFDRGELDKHELLVDALLGTGLERPLAGEWLAAVDAINAAALPVLAIDIPSGLHADTGAVLGAAIRADVTVTFIAHKVGLYTGEGPQQCGLVRFDDLGVTGEAMPAIEPQAYQLQQAWVRQWLLPRSRAAHKGDFGHVLAVGGQPGMAGAIRLTGEAAARTGAGLVSVATHPGHAPAISAARPELMVKGILNTEDMRHLAKRASVIALGPGLGQNDWGKSLWASAITLDKPMVLDADGLNLLAQYPVTNRHWVLTPHPGEAARLLGCSAAEVQADRFAAVRTIQGRYGGVVVLKGTGTLIFDGATCLLSSSGNPGMASGGMGDVLTGMIAGLLAQGLPPLASAAVAVYLHGAAADRVARNGGERGLLASDVLADLRGGMNPRGD